MKVKLLKTKDEYNKACKRIYKLINSSSESIEQNSTIGEELELLSLLVENYEQVKSIIPIPTPIEAIQFRMDQMNLKQKDIAVIFGGKTRISEVLNEKRQLTLKMITLLHRYLGIPYESLCEGNHNIKLSSDKKSKILTNPAIKQYYNLSKKSNKTEHNDQRNNF